MFVQEMRKAGDCTRGLSKEMSRHTIPSSEQLQNSQAASRAQAEDGHTLYWTLVLKPRFPACLHLR